MAIMPTQRWGATRLRLALSCLILISPDYLAWPILVAKYTHTHRPLKSHYKSTAHTCMYGGVYKELKKINKGEGGALRQVPRHNCRGAIKRFHATREVPCPKSRLWVEVAFLDFRLKSSSCLLAPPQPSLPPFLILFFFTETPLSCLVCPPPPPSCFLKGFRIDLYLYLPIDNERQLSCACLFADFLLFFSHFSRSVPPPFSGGTTF